MSCPIYTQHCKHTWSILHVLASGVCMSVSRSVRRSVRGLDLRSLAPQLHPSHLHVASPSPQQNSEQGWSPVSVRARGRTWVSASAPAQVLCVCVVQVCVRARVHACTRMYTGSLCASMYKGQSVWSQVGRAASAPGSQVDSPQVSRCRDGVALRTEFLGTQGPQPALLTVHMPTLDGR